MEITAIQVKSISAVLLNSQNWLPFQQISADSVRIWYGKVLQWHKIGMICTEATIGVYIFEIDFYRAVGPKLQLQYNDPGEILPMGEEEDQHV